MTLRLPEERPLPERQAMLQRVLTAPAEPEPRRSPALLPVAAGVVGAIIGAAATFGLVGAREPVEVVPAATGAPTSRATQAQPLQPGQTARFRDFEVTVSEPKQLGDTFSFRLRVCVLKATSGPVRVSVDPWSARTTGYRTPINTTINRARSTFPLDSTHAAGECPEGEIIATVVDPNTSVLELEYENSVGDRAIWLAR